MKSDTLFLWLVVVAVLALICGLSIGETGATP